MIDAAEDPNDSRWDGVKQEMEGILAEIRDLESKI